MYYVHRGFPHGRADFFPQDSNVTSLSPGDTFNRARSPIYNGITFKSNGTYATKFCGCGDEVRR